MPSVSLAGRDRRLYEVVARYGDPRAHALLSGVARIFKRHAEVEVTPDRLVSLDVLAAGRGERAMRADQPPTAQSDVTSTLSGAKLTDRTQTPSRRSKRENAAQTRMSSSSIGLLDLRTASSLPSRTAARRLPPGSAAWPGPQEHRRAARGARPCRAALDRPATLRSRSLSRVALRANCPCGLTPTTAAPLEQQDPCSAAEHEPRLTYDHPRSPGDHRRPQSAKLRKSRTEAQAGGVGCRRAVR
jgi:hypothetical protein